MNEFSVGQIEKFRATVSEFKAAWKHLVLRAGWIRVKEVNACAFLHADLLPGPPEEPSPDPSVPPFHAATVVQGAESLSSFLDDLGQGRVQLGDEKIQLVFVDEKGQSHPAFPFICRMEGSRHEVPHLRRGPATVRLEGGMLPLGTLWGGSEGGGEIEAKWRALPQPYRDMGDVFSSYFGEPERRADSNPQCFVNVVARLPLDFAATTTLTNRRLVVAIDAHPKLDLEKVSVGAVLDRPSGLPLRSSLTWPPTGWKGGKSKATATRSVPSRRASSATLYLRYGDAVLGKFSQDLPQVRAGNDSVRVHEVLDPERRRLRRWLAGDGDDKGNRRGHLFEAAFVWLLHLLRLPALPYGAETNEVDAVCLLEDRRVALVVECTTANPEFRDKIAKLFARARDLKKVLPDYGFIPILATSLASKDISQDHLERAGKDFITVLSARELDVLLKAMGDGSKVEEVIAFLAEGGCAVRADSLEGQIGNRRQWTRGGWAKDA